MVFFDFPALPFRHFILMSMIFVMWTSHAAPSGNHHILIDPGHGGRDVGAHVGPYKESEVVWKWALALKRDLIDKGFRVTLSRNESGPTSREGRIRKAQDSRPDFIISLHANYFIDPRVRGIEYFILNPLSWDDQKLQWAHEETERAQSLRLKSAKADDSVESFSKQAQVTTIVEDLKKQARTKKSLKMAQLLQREWKGRLKQGSFEILSHTQFPAVLVELGFLSSPVDQKNLLEPRFINHHSALLARAIHDYFHNGSSSQINP